MAVEVCVTYDGDLHCTAIHGPSGSRLTTDAPTDNGGRGEAFSPTDLVGTALGTCILTIMGLIARQNDWDLRGARLHVTKEMVADPQRRIGALRVKVTMPATRTWTPEDRRKLERVPELCPVTQSLDKRVEVPFEFVWPE